MRKLVLAAIAAAGFTTMGPGLFGFALYGTAMAQTPIIIKFSHVVSPDAPKGKAAIVFKDLAEKYTGDKVKVEVYS